MLARRLFSEKIIMSDAFLDLSKDARCLYISLCMSADDDGFVGNPRSIIRQTGAEPDSLEELASTRFILCFESGVICIKHWFINNSIRSDRKKATTYVEERNTLTFDEKGAYVELKKSKIDNQVTTKTAKMTTTCQPSDNQLPTNCQPTANQVTTTRQDKTRQDNNNTFNKRGENGSTCIIPPTPKTGVKDGQTSADVFPSPTREDCVYLSSLFSDLKLDRDAVLPKQEAEELRRAYEASDFAKRTMRTVGAIIKHKDELLVGAWKDYKREPRDVCRRPKMDRRSSAEIDFKFTDLNDVEV